MPKFVTPARLAAALGVLTGLSASVTALLGALPADSTVTRSVVGAAGVLGACATFVKFLEGQASWEATPVGQAQAAVAAAEQPVFVAEDTPALTTGIDETYAPVSAGAPSAS